MEDIHMTWDRKKSNLEKLMVEILKKEKELRLSEIVEKIINIYPDAFTGQTPTNSLYSIIYRKEKNRCEKEMPTLFVTKKVRRAVIYSLNPKNSEFQ